MLGVIDPFAVPGAAMANFSVLSFSLERAMKKTIHSYATISLDLFRRDIE
jgi:hypothetical protein